MSNAFWWGTFFWKFFHIFSLLYPDNPSLDDKNHARNFVKNITYIIPCPSCARHFRNNLKKINLENFINCQKDFIIFFFDLHNTINKFLKKNTYNYNNCMQFISEFILEGNILFHFGNIKNFIKKNRNIHNKNIFFNSVQHFFSIYNINI